MWLLNTTTLELELFLGKDVPSYAILSHTWGKDEVTLQESQAGYTKQTKEKAGFAKLQSFCVLAKDHAFDYAWMDTCCIDKTSSAELSESINSMYQWYKNSDVCYVYLEDVYDDENFTDKESNFWRSRWFSRGWTLQELIAPSCIYFYTAYWKIIGHKERDSQSGKARKRRERLRISSAPDLCKLLSTITGISPRVLQDCSNLPRCSIAQRMSWAACRQTTKPEDAAYCLMGLFDINMPLLYGEGEEKAFFRLQEEILRFTEDDTLLMHLCPESDCCHYYHSILATSPKGFRGLGNIERGEKGPLFHGRKIMSQMTPKGLQVQLPICSCTLLSQREGSEVAFDAYVAILDCKISGSYLNRGVIVLMKHRKGFFALIANTSMAQLDYEKQEVLLQREDLNTYLKATSIQTKDLRLETIYISNSREKAEDSFSLSSVKFPGTNFMFQAIEQPEGSCVILESDTFQTIVHWTFLAKNYKVCLFVDKNNGDAFVVSFGVYMRVLDSQGVGHSVPYCKIFTKMPKKTLQDIQRQESWKQLYPDERPKSFERDGLEEPPLIPAPGSQSATLELSGSRTAVVTVDRHALLDREEYRFKLTIKKKD